MLKERGHFFILQKCASQLQLTINWIGIDLVAKFSSNGQRFPGGVLLKR